MWGTTVIRGGCYETGSLLALRAAAWVLSQGFTLYLHPVTQPLSCRIPGSGWARHAEKPVLCRDITAFHFHPALHCQAYMATCPFCRRGALWIIAALTH